MQCFQLFREESITFDSLEIKIELNLYYYFCKFAPMVNFKDIGHYFCSVFIPVLCMMYALYQ